MKEVAALNLRPVQDVNVQDVLKAVTPLCQSKPATGEFLIRMIKAHFKLGRVRMDIAIKRGQSGRLELDAQVRHERAESAAATLLHCLIPTCDPSFKHCAMRRRSTPAPLSSLSLCWARKRSAGYGLVRDRFRQCVMDYTRQANEGWGTASSRIVSSRA